MNGAGRSFPWALFVASSLTGCASMLGVDGDFGVDPSDGGSSDAAVVADGFTIDANVLPDSAPDTGSDTGSDTRPDSAPPPVPCADSENEKQAVLDAALARCNGLTNPTFLGINFSPQFAVESYCDANAKRTVLCLFQPEMAVSGDSLDGHCANAKIQEGAASITANTYYRYVSGNTGSLPSNPAPAIARLTAAVGGASRWARQTGGAGNGALLSLDKYGRVESPTPSPSFSQKAACTFRLQ